MCDVQVKTLTEEATNRKAFTDSLKRRLSVATKEKSQYETTCQDLKEGLDKKVAALSVQAHLSSSVCDVQVDSSGNIAVAYTQAGIVLF